MTKDRKVLLACIVAPLATPLVFDIFAFFKEGLPQENILEVVIIGGSLYLPFAYAAEILLGLPLFAIFVRYRIRSTAAFALGGALIGWIVSFALGLGARPGRISSSLIFILAGSVSAVVFRAIAQAEEVS